MAAAALREGGGVASVSQVEGDYYSDLLGIQFMKLLIHHSSTIDSRMMLFMARVVVGR